ncbi:cell wall-binding repeat-containing protein, partial [Mobiluncus mulieris]|uniref:cell wall-binding repeat-containing protein n=1 Tax=Mobiluncus mulieris TaxID=2052 RepID=UPI0018C8C44B
FAVGAASVALIASLGGVAPAVADSDRTNVSLPGFITSLGRLADADRVGTSLKVAEHAFKGKAPEVLYVASGADANLVDAASAGMLQDGPLAFVSNNSYVASAVGKFFANNFKSISKVVAIGGTAAVSDVTLKAVAEQLDAKTGRLAGEDRYGTSAAIAQHVYDAALKDGYKDRLGQPVVSGRSNLRVAYLANGADDHVVDSMVAGTLDNGPVLLVKPDGKVPEKVAEFIKKALPEQFAALGGTSAVSDATVQDAWVIKTLANKWDTSYDVPELKRTSMDLKDLINGVNARDSRQYDSGNFMGLDKIVKDASRVKDAWDWAYTQNKHNVEDAISKANETPNTFVKRKQDGVDTISGDTGNKVRAALQALYGNLVGNDNGALTKLVEYFEYGEEKDGKKPVIGFDFKKFEGLKGFKDLAGGAQDSLKKVWESQRNARLGTPSLTPVATRSQVTPEEGEAKALYNSASASPNADLANPVAVVRAVADWVYDQESKWLESAQKQLADANLKLRQDYDKISTKVSLRLGGKDRFETAQLIANQYGNLYGGLVNDLPKDVKSPFTEAYVANGFRLPDSLTAGQLPSGPILLVRKDGDVPEFTVKVAKNLKSWLKEGAHLDVYGIGGTAVLPDVQLGKMAELIDTGASKYLKIAKSKVNPNANNANKGLSVTADAANKDATYGTVKENKFVVKQDDAPLTGLAAGDVKVTLGGADKTSDFDVTCADSTVTVKTKAATAAGEYKVEVTKGDTTKRVSLKVAKMKLTKLALASNSTGFKKDAPLTLGAAGNTAVETSGSLVLQPKEDGSATSLAAAPATITYTLEPAAQKFKADGTADSAGKVTASITNNNKITLTPNAVGEVSNAVKADVKVKVAISGNNANNYELSNSGVYTVPVWFKAQ